MDGFDGHHQGYPQRNGLSGDAANGATKRASKEQGEPVKYAEKLVDKIMKDLQAKREEEQKQQFESWQEQEGETRSKRARNTKRPNWNDVFGSSSLEKTGRRNYLGRRSTRLKAGRQLQYKCLRHCLRCPRMTQG